MDESSFEKVHRLEVVASGEANKSSGCVEEVIVLSDTAIKKFQDTIEQSEIEDLSTEFDEIAVKEATRQLQETGIFLLGETHGVKENPDIIYSLMKKLGCRGIALEWNKSLTPYIQKYLQTGKLAINRAMEIQINAGMVTAGHFALLRRLENEGMLDKLILFDEGLSIEAEESGNGAEMRDANMARNLRTNLDRTLLTLVISGAIHVNTEETDANGDMVAKKPMGAHLKEYFPSIHPGKIQYRKGSYYNNGAKEFTVDNTIALRPSFSIDLKGDYVYSLPEAHAAVALS